MKIPLLLLLAAFLVIGLTAETIIPAGPVSGSWDAAGSPYRIMGDISISDLQSLTVGPGVDVVFQGTYKLDVYGQIVCNGNVDNNITFTAQDTLLGWQSIRFSNSGSAGNQPSAFTYTNFSYGKAVNGASVSDPLNSGGAIWADFAGTLTFDHCQFIRCMTAADGGAVYAKNQTNINMNGCLIKGCDTEWFGGVYIEDGSANFTDCAFFANYSNVFGAAMYILECPAINITSCKFELNSANAVGCIYCLYSPLVIKNSLFQGNHTVTGRGGSIGITHGSCEITNCTFAGNSTPMDGGAVWLNILDQPGAFTNCIFWDNQPDAVSNIETTYTLSYCSTQVAQGGATNIHGNPLFADEENDDFTLLPTSPCIDMGTPDTTGLGLPLTDLLGQPRVVDGDDDGVARIDMGCYERPPVTHTGEIAGQVTSTTGDPIAGAVVTAGTVTANTDAWGLYSMTVPAGVYSVTCSKEGYAPATQDNVTVTANGMVIVNFVLTAVAVSDPADISPVVSLEAYPNPFSASTEIVFNISRAMPVRVEIFNVRGQLVGSLLQAGLGKGGHRVVWDGRTDAGGVAGRGVYFCRLSAEGKTLILRLLRY